MFHAYLYVRLFYHSSYSLPLSVNHYVDVYHTDNTHTPLTVPAPVCNAPQSDEGVITAMWSYNHTGGLPLTDVSVFYTYEEGATINSIAVQNTYANTTSVMVGGLVAGFRYSFNVTAENSNGSASILCGPTLLVIGE